MTFATLLATQAAAPWILAGAMLVIATVIMWTLVLSIVGHSLGLPADSGYAGCR